MTTKLTPTEYEAQKLEMNDKKCNVCIRHIKLSTGKAICTTGQTYPLCKGNRKKGFVLISNEGDVEQ